MNNAKMVNSNKKELRDKVNQEQSPYNIIYRKELSILGRIIVSTFYIIFIVVLTKSYIKPQKDHNLSERLLAIEKSQQQSLKVLHQKNLTRPSTQTSNRLIRTEFENMKHQFKLIIDKEQQSQRIINTQKEEILALKKKLQEFLVFNINQVEPSKEKTLTYSSENLNNLYYRHRLKLKKLRSEQNRKQQFFTQNLDLTDIKLKGKYDELRSKHKIEYNELENKLAEQIKQFRANKYINVAAH